MTTGSWDRSAGDIVDVGSWSGEDDPQKLRVNNFTKSAFFRYNPESPVWHNSSQTFRDVRPSAMLYGISQEADYLLDLKLRGRVVRALKGHQFHLGKLLGESRQSLSMIGSSATGITQYVRRLTRIKARLKRLPLAAAEKLLRGKSIDEYLGGLWLSWSLGWRPLLADAENAAIAVAHTMDPQKTTYRVKASVSSPNSVIGGFPVGNGWWEAKDAETRRSKQVYFQIREDMSLPDNLGVTDLAGVAWEVMTLSFVVDWFIPIGSWLEARAVIGSVVSDKVIITTKTSAFISGISAQGDYAGAHPLRLKSFGFNRASASNLDFLTQEKPRFTDFTKIFAGDIGVQKALTAISLLVVAKNRFLST